MLLSELKTSLNQKMQGDFDSCHVMIKYIDNDGTENFDLVTATSYIEEPFCVVLLGNKVIEKMIKDGEIDENGKKK